MSEKSSQKHILEGWKEIADFCGRTVRCVQVWEKERGLPIHRIAGMHKVFAYPAEIKDWMNSGRECTKDLSSFDTHPRDAANRQNNMAWKYGDSRQVVIVCCDCGLTVVTPANEILNALHIRESFRIEYRCSYCHQIRYFRITEVIRNPRPTRETRQYQESFEAILMCCECGMQFAAPSASIIDQNDLLDEAYIQTDFRVEYDCPNCHQTRHFRISEVMATSDLSANSVSPAK
jgi:hypothetical protein